MFQIRTMTIMQISLAAAGKKAFYNLIICKTRYSEHLANYSKQADLQKIYECCLGFPVGGRIMNETRACPPKTYSDQVQIASAKLLNVSLSNTLLFRKVTNLSKGINLAFSIELTCQKTIAHWYMSRKFKNQAMFWIRGKIQISTNIWTQIFCS